eukprot:TRINITY_DN8202_c0_g1_i6.p1 TRINITY_DN8202_c0_g1~~TRINITY_DN8202_c0_g1_i6.p1  ORF type:complete len:722 (-),score=183.31 TRINITY_DN8202_c0_g1_i6:12-2177(-)
MDEDPRDEISESGSDESESSEIIENIDKPFIPKPWVTPTVEETANEISAFAYKNSRPLIRMQFIKKRRDFGQPCKLNDKEAIDPIEIRQQQNDPSFMTHVKKRVLEMGLQAANQTVEAATQVVYNRKVNKKIRAIPEKQSSNLEEDDGNLLGFLSNAYPLMEDALQCNETIDIFQDDFDILKEEEIVTEGNETTTNDIKEIKSYTLNDKKVTCISFPPSTANSPLRYIIAESFVENWNFEKRLEESLKSNESFILILEFEELHMVQPLYRLVSPVEITSFDFNPLNPNKIVGCAINGQVLLWDLKGALKVAEKSTGKKTKREKREDQEIPRVLPEVISAPQEPNSIPPPSSELVRKNVNSHKGPALCVRWLPKAIKMDLKTFSNVLPNTAEVTQFVSIGVDGQILFWETKFPSEQDPRVYPEMYPWRANYAIQLFRPGGGGLLGGVQLVFHKDQKNSSFFAASDEGELFQVDWGVKPTEENAKPDMITNLWSSERALRSCVALDRSPFFDDIILTVFDFHFCIWRTDIEVPIFSSMIIQGAHITCGAFSPSRPGVVIVGRSDGYLNVWDFVDQSHKYIIHQNVASVGLSALRFHETMVNILAVGDMLGNLHVLELPKSLCKKIGSEEATIAEFWRREVERVRYVDKRWNVRTEDLKKKKAEQEKLEAAESKKEAAKKDENEMSDDEKEEQEYAAFVKQYIEEQIEGKLPPPQPGNAKGAKR